MRTTRPDQTTFTTTPSDRPDTTLFGRYLATRRNYTETAIDLRQALRRMPVELETLADVLVVYDGERHWLVDGYHRWHAHKALNLPEIEAEVRLGTPDDAIRLSLQANAAHGKRREPSDYRRAYQIAVRYKLVSATDSAAVKEMIACSSRLARDLTAKAREKQVAARDVAVKAKKAEGKTNREIAKEVGVAETTVRAVLGGARKRQTAISAHPRRPTRCDPIEADPDDPRQTDLEEFLVEAETAPTGADIARAKLAEMETPRAQRWHKAHETGGAVHG